jgi:hypothetical protein
LLEGRLGQGTSPCSAGEGRGGGCSRARALAGRPEPEPAGQRAQALLPALPEGLQALWSLRAGPDGALAVVQETQGAVEAGCSCTVGLGGPLALVYNTI